MLVIIPCFKRSDSLYWVLLSLLQAQVNFPVSESLRVVLVNNFPPARLELEGVVKRLKIDYANQADLVSISFLHREKTLNPVESWYSAIREHALPEEVVLLNGDDDLFLPRSLLLRYKYAISTEADIVLTRSEHGLLFMSDNKSCLCPPFVKKRDVDFSGTISQEFIDSWGPAFIGNHCYRYTKNFVDALELSELWCSKQSWIDSNTRTLMLPYYLPFALERIGGILQGLDLPCVIRGAGAAELKGATFGVPGWNPGFLCWHAKNLLVTNGFYIPPSCSLNKMAAGWFLTYFFDRRIGFLVLIKCIKKIGLPLSWWHPSSIAFGLRILVTAWLGLRRIRQLWNSKKKSIAISVLLKSLLIEAVDVAA